MNIKEQFQSFVDQNPFTPIGQFNAPDLLPRTLIKRLGKAVNKDDEDMQKIGSLYWQTIYPLMQSGHFHAAATRQFRFPRRIGIFPGMSCMFDCSFCGREKGVNYERTDLATGIENYKRLLYQLPRTGPRKFVISGGLEPLTNPRIGEIIGVGLALGYVMDMYTNGYMLTRQYLDKQQNNMLALNRIRVSIYGFDDQSYLTATGKANGWKIVKENLINLLKHSEESVDVNWVILPGKIDDIMLLLSELRAIQAAGGRPFNTISFREDFTGNQAIVGDERKYLREVLDKAKEFKDEYLNRSFFDFGYKVGCDEPLARATVEQLDTSGYPQISINVDIAGGVYVYKGSAFPGRKLAGQYKIGNLNNDDIEMIIRNHLKRKVLPANESTLEMMDAYDHAVTLALHTYKQNVADGYDIRHIPYNIVP